MEECVSPTCDATYDPSEVGKCPECNAPSKTAGNTGEDADAGITCSNCGESLDSGTQYCIECGEPLSEDTAESVQKPKIQCPEANCDGHIPEGKDYCLQCGEPRDELGDTGIAAGGGDSGSSASASQSKPDVTFDIDGHTTEIVKSGDIQLDNDEERPDNSFGMAARKAAVRGGADAEEAKRIHRDHLLVEVKNDSVIIEDNGLNLTEHNGEGLSKGDRRELSDGDQIDLSGVVTVDVKVS